MRFIRSGSFADDPSWVVSEHDDPGEVAAAYAQQQLVAAVRRKAGGNVTAADVARALGRQGEDRTVPEFWAGRRAITMRMWFALAIAYDLDPLAYAESDDRRTLLPAAHRSWLGLWRPGDGLPRFRAPFESADEPAWINAAQWLSEWLDEEDHAGLLRLADTRIAVHATARALAETGLPVDLVADPSEAGTHVRYGLSYETEPRTDIAVHLIPDSPLINRDS
ncbi:MAG TPA: hypothetical protein VGR06_16120, partial [Actinophytocola sp.]|uniref:hypothetical protein n=1 Tax=Actinophytocola sp. TaxID=1872138 RepID=UPI002DFCEA35|nr:hypothetical protein [Actinophytocola sp.]